MTQGDEERSAAVAGERQRSAGERFCPTCRRVATPDDLLCPSCGDRVVESGFCPTCEASWRLPIGALCPKHDLPLEPTPTPQPWPEHAGADHWVTVATYNHPNEANAPRIRLEAEGVPTFLDGERIAGTTLYQVATGGVRLQVPASLVSPARILLTQQWAVTPSGTPEADLEDDDDPWAGLAPSPGVRRRTIMKGAILLFLFGPVLATLGSVLLRWLAGQR